MGDLCIGELLYKDALSLVVFQADENDNNEQQLCFCAVLFYSRVLENAVFKDITLDTGCTA